MGAVEVHHPIKHSGADPLLLARGELPLHRRMYPRFVTRDDDPPRSGGEAGSEGKEGLIVIVTLIVACEVGFWVLLFAGLGTWLGTRRPV